MKNGRGFTLIELLMVVSIVALLSSIVLASLNVARTRAAIGAGLQFDANVYHAAADQAVGIWDLDDCSGTGAVDRSGSGNNGTLTNGAAYISSDTPTGKGCSVSFDGSNDFILIPDATSMNFTGDVTLSAWIKPNVIGGGYKTFMTKRGASTNYQLFLHTTAGALSWYNGTQYNSTYIPPINQWTHVAGVITGTTLILYANGQAVYKATVPAVGGATGNPFYIGSINGSEAFGGLIDSVRVYAKSLTASDIGKMYAAGLPTHPLAAK